MILSVIAAIAENNAIGKDNKLLWHLSSDMKIFRNLTMGHPILMGRKTFESIGKPLPGRLNIIISRKPLQVEGAVVAHSLEKAIKLAEETNDSEAFVIGGGEIYTLALPLAEKLYITHVKSTIEGDTFFPEINALLWTPIQNLVSEKDDKNEYDFEFIEYIRNRD